MMRSFLASQNPILVITLCGCGVLQKLIWHYRVMDDGLYILAWLRRALSAGYEVQIVPGEVPVASSLRHLAHEEPKGAIWPLKLGF